MWTTKNYLPREADDSGARSGGHDAIPEMHGEFAVPREYRGGCFHGHAPQFNAIAGKSEPGLPEIEIEIGTTPVQGRNKCNDDCVGIVIGSDAGGNESHLVHSVAWSGHGIHLGSVSEIMLETCADGF